MTDDDNVERCTFGIEISTMQLSGKDLFSVWDFAGQVESFITHQFFISTQSTVFTVLVDLTKSIEKQREQLLCWLGFIKMRNLGQVSCIVLLSHTYMYIKMFCFVQATDTLSRKKSS